MTDREAAAGLVERLESLAGLMDEEIYLGGAATATREAATLITTLLSELERVGKERDEAREIVAACNNSVFGTHSYFADANGKTTAQGIEEIKDFSGAQWLRANAAEARALKAEKERDSLKLQAQGHAMEARSANATIYDAYQAVTGATGEPGNWNGAEPIKAELDRLRALVAEAVRVLGGLGIKPPDGPLESILWGDMPEETLGTLSVQLKHFRAARAFIEKAKS